MPEFVNGLPLHALVVHFVVVLLPLAVLGAVVVALWPAARARFGWLVVGAAAVATILVPIATDSGEKLETRLPRSDQIDDHQDLGQQLIWFALLFLVAVAALMVVHEVGRRREVSWGKVATIAVAVVTIGASVATGVHVFRVGEAGSRAVWEGYENVPPQER
ncbi:MAG TPA: DUF2231 domain-containing protein [Actinophytocola sp.]|uniref:DUF2231 domain-containing protein n=1 Tax=Actinophytocola sp. TaxID=1872138 RepID=UPI002DB65CE1|nr:DUF2231 domain-containing protein [Actinophytocola sp.]HEU5469078.1 DUF2231 domain-containing protein [Actinophytocola sp.]